MEEEKSTGEKIVEMLCDGKTIKQIEAELEISHRTLENLLREVRYGAGLPYEKRTYKARKDDILANLEKWKEHRKRLRKIEQQFRASLVYFDF
jgi:transposase